MSVKKSVTGITINLIPFTTSLRGAALLQEQSVINQLRLDTIQDFNNYLQLPVKQQCVSLVPKQHPFGSGKPPQFEHCDAG